MAKRLRIRQKGKLKFSEYFKKIDDGINVAIVTNPSIRFSFPKRLNGRTGKTIGTRGKFKLVEIKDGNKMKKFIIHPIHLRKV